MSSGVFVFNFMNLLPLSAPPLLKQPVSKPPAPPVLDQSLPQWREALQHDIANFYVLAQRECGDVFEFRLLGKLELFHVSHPDDLAVVFKGSNESFRKGRRWDNFRLLVGQGLITVEPQQWLQQRRSLQPAFLRRYHEHFATRIEQSVQETLVRFGPLAQSGETIHVTTEMARLTLRNAGHTLFGTELGDLTEPISEHMAAVLEYIVFWPMYAKHKRTLGVYLPRTKHGRFRRSLRILEEAAQTIIRRRQEIRREEARREDPEAESEGEKQAPDLLDLLLQQLEESEVGRDVFQRASPRFFEKRRRARLVRDQMMSFLFTGRETTAAVLSWVWFLLAQHPEAEARLHQELDRVLDGRPPARADLEHLPFLGQVVNETLRLYPPVWSFLRETTRPEIFSGYALPSGSTLHICPYSIHRHPDFWDEPEKFDPERFTPEREAARHPFAYVPFGAGPRQCIGKYTALLEAQLIVAGIAQHFVLRPVSGVEVRSNAVISLWPSHNLPMTLHPR